jgi:hypothetical protein
MRISEILKRISLRQEISTIYICPLCKSSFEKEEEAKRCLAKGIPDIALTPRTKIGEVVRVDEDAELVVTDYGLDPEHKHVVCFVKMILETLPLNSQEEMLFYDMETGKNLKIIQLLEERTSIIRTYRCPICLRGYNTPDLAINCQKKGLPSIVERETGLEINDLICSPHTNDYFRVIDFKLSQNHNEIWVMLRPEGISIKRGIGADALSLSSAQKGKELALKLGK